MLEYIVKYQNSYISSYLFKTNLPSMLEKGVPLEKLLSSKVFLIEFDYDEWPSIHHDDTYDIKPYNHSVFELREYYDVTFPGYGTID